MLECLTKELQVLHLSSAWTTEYLYAVAPLRALHSFHKSWFFQKIYMLVTDAMFQRYTRQELEVIFKSRYPSGMSASVSTMTFIYILHP